MAQQMNMQQIMKQAQKMQKQLESMQDDLRNQEFSSSTGGGMVKVTATGDMRITSLEIDPQAVDPEDVEILQDMIIAAVNDVLDTVNEAANKQMGGIAGGLGIPGLM